MAGSGESEQQRLNRELIELLNELRVALPGVQVLFAFLLAALVFALLWVALPLGRRVRTADDSDG